jgi:hypothetical protein
MNRYRVSILVAMLLALATASQAQDSPPPKVHRSGDLSYVSGGVDPQERKALVRMAERYQVQLSFKLLNSDEKLKGVKVSMIDYKGEKAVETLSEGPIFFVNPPHGRWTIQAEYGGETHTKTVDVNGRFYVTWDVSFKGGASTD